MNTKHWYTSKAIILAILQAIVGVLIVVSSQYPDVGYVAVMKSVLDLVIRLNTTTTISA